MPARLPAWVDSELVTAGATSAPGHGTYTTGRWNGERILHGRLVCERLVRDAAALGFARLDAELLEAGLLALARAAFGSKEGIVRLEARDPNGPRPHLVGTTRPLGQEPRSWRVVTAPVVHPGPARALGAKLWRPEIDQARQAMLAADAHEVLLFDAEGFLVEGARSAFALRLHDGRAVSPPAARGGVRSVAREVVMSRHPALVEADVRREDLLAAREIVALNSVRGACRVTSVDGEAVGREGDDPMRSALQRAFAQG